MASPEERFWDWFQQNEQRLYNFEENRESVFDDLGAQMSKVHEDLTFEFSPIFDNGQRRFVISAGGIKSAFTAVEKLFDVAPKLDRWTWVKFRPRSEVLLDIEYGDTKIPADEVHYLMAKDEDKIGLVLFFDNYTEEQEHIFGNVGYLYLDQALGELAVETQVGFIEFHSRESKYFEQARPIAELQDHFDEYWSSVTD